MKNEGRTPATRWGDVLKCKLKRENWICYFSSSGMGELICYNMAVGLEPIDETRETRCARISGAFVFGMLQRAWFPNLFFYLLDSPWKNWKIYNKEGIENFTPLSTSSRRIFSSILSFFVFNCHCHKGRRHLAGSHRFLRFYCYLPTKKTNLFLLLFVLADPDCLQPMRWLRNRQHKTK